MFRRFLRNRSGASAVEYGILLAALALTLSIGFNNVAEGLNFLFADNTSKLRSIYPGGPPPTDD